MTYKQGVKNGFLHAWEEEAWGNLNAVSYYLTGEFREYGGRLFSEAQRQNERQQALITRREIPIRYWETRFHSEGGQTLAVNTLFLRMLRTAQDTAWSTLI